MNDTNLHKNASGYDDPTAYKAIRSIQQDEARFHKLMDTIFNVCELSGFHLEGRITVRDKKTGRIWR